MAGIAVQLQPRRLTEGLKNITKSSGLVWSPDSRYLALITPARILILEP
ncbi:MAG: hypothetical protein KKA73_02230 [Chloroflexi bacterium]|nr:hypothetical protein [Chloroflexota bacterium]MBU1746484.1 hypothetical protein [Chloroflexota bacterium]